MFPPTVTQASALGAMLRAMRQGVGMSLSDLAERVGAHKATLSRIENGQRVAGAELLSRIAQVIADEIKTLRDAA